MTGGWHAEEYHSGAMVNRRLTYILAVPRDLRETFPEDWQARVRELGGLAAEPSASPHRLQIEADDAALERVREAFGDLLQVERLAPRTF